MNIFLKPTLIDFINQVHNYDSSMQQKGDRCEQFHLKVSLINFLVAKSFHFHVIS